MIAGLVTTAMKGMIEAMPTISAAATKMSTSTRNPRRMRTVDAASRHDATQLSISLTIFVAVYLLVFGMGTLYGLRVIAKGPFEHESKYPPRGGPGEARQPMRPLSAVEEGMNAPTDLSARRI